MADFDVKAVAQVIRLLLSAALRTIFWNTRQADILGQIIIILGGAFCGCHSI